MTSKEEHNFAKLLYWGFNPPPRILGLTFTWLNFSLFNEIIVVFILNDFFVPNIDVEKNTGTCGDQMISMDECKAHAGRGWGSDTTPGAYFLFPSGCFRGILPSGASTTYHFNRFTTSVQCSANLATNVGSVSFRCVCSKGKSEINWSYVTCGKCR